MRGYGNFLLGRKYEEQYEKVSRYVLEHREKKILFLELGVGRLTPMFIQEPFWNLTLAFPCARYIAVNDRYGFLPKPLEDKGMAIVADIAGCCGTREKSWKMEKVGDERSSSSGHPGTGRADRPG